MIHLNPFAVSGLLIVITCLPLFFFVLKYSKTNVAKIFSFHLLSAALWGVGAFLVATNNKPENTLFIWKLAKIPVPFIAVTIFHAVSLLSRKYSRLTIAIAYLQAIFFVILIMQGHFFSHKIKLMFESIYWYEATNSYVIMFTIWLLFFSAAHIKLIKYYMSIFPEQKRQIFFLLLAAPIGYGGGMMNFLPGLGMTIYPYGNFLVPIYSVMVAYAILKHQLLNIELVVKKSVSYSILLTLVSLFYLVTIFLIEKILQGVIGYRSIFLSLLTAFIVGIIFLPLRNRIQYFLDRFFFKGTHVQIAEENERLRQELAKTERLKAVSTLASGLAHEVKNPLTAIKTFTEYLPDRKNDPEFLDKFSKIVGHEVNRIDGLVHQLLDFAKPSPLKLEKANIHGLIDNLLDFLSSELIKHKIKIEKRYYHETAMVLHVDPNQFKQALLNILLNAIEAMPNGGTLCVQTTDIRPQTTDQKSKKSGVWSLGSGVSGDYFKITISDTGTGINPKDLPHIFDPFYSKKDGGTGLGLSITHQIIKEHRGNIKVESKVEKGTTFIIELPVSNS